MWEIVNSLIIVIISSLSYLELHYELKVILDLNRSQINILEMKLILRFNLIIYTSMLLTKSFMI